MSNNIISSIQSDLATIGGLDEDTKAEAGGRVSGSKRLSIKGGIFRNQLNLQLRPNLAIFP